jgi:hypothetical protein
MISGISARVLQHLLSHPYEDYPCDDRTGAATIVTVFNSESCCIVSPYSSPKQVFMDVRGQIAESVRVTAVFIVIPAEYLGVDHGDPQGRS